MKILLITTGLGVGGAERVLIDLADALVERGCIVKVAYLTGEASLLPKSSDIEVIPIRMVRGSDFLSAYVALRRVLRSFRPDVVHSHMVHANIMARLLRLTTPIPRLVCTSHSSNEGGFIRMLAYRLTDHLADISTNVSDEAVSALISRRAVKQGRMLSIPNGIDTDKFRFDANARARVRLELGLGQRRMALAVGRLDEAKDYPSLFAAVKLLLKKRDDFRLFVVGHGPLENYLKRLVQTLGIAHNVVFLGIRHDVADLMSAADVFVLSSAWEGFGLVVAEAMACERVVVATECGGVKQIMSGSGLTVKCMDSRALSEALDTALSFNPDFLRSLGKSARQKILEKYSLNSMVDGYMNIYVNF